jgi:peroxiredoxin
VKERYEEFKQLYAEVLAISFAPPPVVAVYREQPPLPFSVVSDPSRKAYEAFGLGRTSWKGMLRLGVVARYLGLLLRGWLPRKASADEDVMQLGGDFVLDRERRVVYAYRSTEPTDRPRVGALLNAIRKAQ